MEPRLFRWFRCYLPQATSWKSASTTSSSPAAVARARPLSVPPPVGLSRLGEAVKSEDGAAVFHAELELPDVAPGDYLLHLKVGGSAGDILSSVTIPIKIRSLE